jgi:membrane protease YdiL (CAAX protease family)
MRRIIFCIVLAFLLWTLMFSPHLAFVNKNVSFWWMMTASALLLTTLSFSFYGKKLKQSLSRFGIKSVLGGILLAALIWGVFFVGDKLSSLMFSFARPQVDSIYGLKASDPHWLIAMLLLLIIGPAEELFWRGYVQDSLTQRYSPNKGFWITLLLYTAVHIPSLNFMLIMAAMVCGLIWGALYRFYPTRFPAILISHAVWDAAVFVWFPI